MSATMQPQPTDTPQLTEALFYARLGWSVVPAHKVIRAQDGTTSCTCGSGAACVSKGKHPAVTWTPYQTKPASENQIREWFTGMFRTYGVGIVTGKVSGIFAIDVDEAPGKRGADTLHDAQMLYGDLPATVQAKTGGGGRHIILKHPGTVAIITAKNVFGPGVDVRGDGGFIVAAPSLHESGRYYLWDDRAHPRTTPLADAPEWVVDLARDDTPPGATRKAPSTGTGEIIRNEWGRVVDGRERHMIGIICGVISSFLGSFGILPDAEHVFANAWPSYARTTVARGASLEEDGRGETLMRQRIGHMLKRAANGKWKLAPPPVDPSPPLPQDVDPETGEILPPSFKATPFDPAKFLNLEPRRWVYGHFLIRRYLSVLGAPGGTGKTAYAMTVGASVALGEPLLGEQVHEPGPVWIYNLEDPEDEALRRMQAICLLHNVDPARLVGRLYLDSGRDRPLVVAIRTESGAIVATPIVELVVEELKARGIKLLIVDPFIKSHKLEENRNEQVDFAASLWNRIADQADCSILLAHHFRKGGVSGEADAFRGASALIDAARSAVSLSTMSDKEADKLGVEDDQRRFHIRMDNAKLNLAPPPAHALWLKLNNVELPNGDHVQATSKWEPPSPWEGLNWALIDHILDRVEAGPEAGEFWAYGRQAKSRWVGNVIMEEAGRTAEQSSSILRAWKENGVLEEGQYASPRQNGSMTGCVRVNPVKFSEMKRTVAGGISDAA